MRQYQWAVVGAGPAGIAAVGQLLDRGVSGHNILWCDPAFQVGDFGQLWSSVPSNTKVKLFRAFLLSCASFRWHEQGRHFALNDYDPEQTCPLAMMVEPLRCVVEQLTQVVTTEQVSVQQLMWQHGCWHLQCAGKTLQADKVILAIGATPKLLEYQQAKPIALRCALNPTQLAQQCDEKDTVAVFGSSHSAVLAIRHLFELPVAKIINFYRSPLRYAVYYQDSILFDNTGLKGTTATWAREFLDDKMPPTIQRVIASDEHINYYLPSCQFYVAAVGFHRRELAVTGISSLSYNHHCGIIAPGLFGVGIAFPEGATDRFGNFEYRVGLWKFMDYLQRVLPLWQQY